MSHSENHTYQAELARAKHMENITEQELERLSGKKGCIFLLFKEKPFPKNGYYIFTKVHFGKLYAYFPTVPLKNPFPEQIILTPLTMSHFS